MCQSKSSSYPLVSAPTAANRKRSYSDINTSSTTNNNKTTMPQPKKPCLKSKRTQLRRSVNFSPRVNMRCFFPSEQESSNWMTKEELVHSKRYAKTLSKMHLHKNGSSPPKSGIVASVRFEFKGESLRGMELVTDVINGRKRRHFQREAMKSVNIEQQQQAQSTSSSLPSIYGSRSKMSLRYARRVSQEDAKIAAEILAEDLSNTQPQEQPVYGSSSCKKAMLSSDPRVAADIIKRFLPQTMTRHCNMVSVQA